MKKRIHHNKPQVKTYGQRPQYSEAFQKIWREIRNVDDGTKNSVIFDIRQAIEFHPNKEEAAILNRKLDGACTKKSFHRIINCGVNLKEIKPSFNPHEPSKLCTTS